MAVTCPAVSSVTTFMSSTDGKDGCFGLLSLYVLFKGQEWVFQQDSAPAHNAKTTQEWLRKNPMAFISVENWSSGSADLKPLDNKLWAVWAV